jgi:hypothetical protein
MQNLPTILSTLNSVRGRALPLSPAAKAAVDAVFNELTNAFGDAAVGRMFGDAPPDDVKRTWSEGLAGFTKSELFRGLQAMKLRKFVPNLGEFLQLCRPALDPETAWMEAELCLRQREDGQVGDWTHPGVFRAAAKMATEVQSGDYMRHRGRWTALLKRELETHGEPVPVPAQRIGYTEGKAVPAPASAKQLAALLKEAQRRSAVDKAARAAGSEG